MAQKILRMAFNSTFPYLQLNKILFSPFSHQLHTNLTPISPRLFKFILPKGQEVRKKGGIFMTFLGLEWYWWLVIVVVLIIAIPFKIKFMKWWSKSQQEKKKGQHGKWGDDE